MIIGVISDTHNSMTRTERAMELFQSRHCGMVMHCGDLANSAILELCSQLPVHFVIGNHDDEAQLRQAAAVSGATCHGELMDQDIDGHRIMMSHGHLKPPVQTIEAAAPSYHLFGHSHVAVDLVESGTRRINPGALFRTKTPSVAIIDTNAETVDFLLVAK